MMSASIDNMQTLMLSTQAMVLSKRHHSMCCPFSHANKLCVRMACVWTSYKQFLDSDQTSDNTACRRRSDLSAQAMYLSGTWTSSSDVHFVFADTDEQGLQVTISNGSKLHGMMDLFEGIHLFGMY